MAADPTVNFDPNTGLVKLTGRDRKGCPRSKTVLRVSPNGIAVWDELQKKEIHINLETLQLWVRQVKRGR